MSVYEFPKHAAIAKLETGIAVKAGDPGSDAATVIIDGTDKRDNWTDDVFELTPAQARLIADALLEAASIAEGQ